MPSLTYLIDLFGIMKQLDILSSTGMTPLSTNLSLYLCFMPKQISLLKVFMNGYKSNLLVTLLLPFTCNVISSVFIAQFDQYLEIAFLVSVPHMLISQ